MAATARRARARVPGGHRPLAAADRRQRPSAAAAAGAARPDRGAELALGAGFRVLTGIEVDINEDGSLDQDPELLAELDVVVASVHSKLRMPGAEMTERMLDGHREPARRRAGPLHGPDGHGQPQARPSRSSTPTPCSPPAPSTGWPSRSTPGRSGSTRPKRLLRQAVEAGCVFTIDTDAHAPGQLDWLRNGCERAVDCECARRSGAQHRGRSRSCSPPPGRVADLAPSGRLPAEMCVGGGWRMGLGPSSAAHARRLRRPTTR